ncbi:MAG TPA: LEPR-XLL domain-containing protein, partial [bacterium]|nr:LEPR-XLL domain-containing protein [bacterium]
MSLASLVRSRLPRPAHTLRVGRRSRRRGADLAPPRPRKHLYEPLEPRLLLSGSPFTYEAAPDAPVKLTLKLVQQAETPTLQLVDNAGAVVASQALASTWWVYVLGSDLDDILTVDLAELFAVPVTFQGRGHGAAGDVLRVAGGGGRAASFTRHAASPDAGTVTVDGTMVEFAEVEPVEIADMATLAITTPGGQDELTVDSPAPGQGRVSGTSDGAVFEVAFTHVLDVALDTGVNDGAAGDDTVILDDSAPSGGSDLSVNTGAGRDTLVGPESGATWEIDGEGSGTVAGVAFAGIESARGGTGEDTIVGPDADNAWMITGPNAGTLNSLSFESIENVIGGAGADTFTFVSGGSLSGRLRGGAGTDTLVGADQDNVWQITGADAGSLNGQAFQEIEHLRGGAGADRFVFAGGSISGTVDGGGGVNTLDYSAEGAGVVVDLAAGAATGTAGFAQITEVVGGAGADTLRGPHAATTWTITGAGAGTVGNVAFTAFDSLQGGAGADLFALGALGGLSGALAGGEGVDTLLAADLANAWEVVGPDTGVLNGLAFLGIETLLGGALDDVFVFALGGSVSSAVAGGAGLDRVRGADRRNRWRIGGQGEASLDETALAGVEALDGGADVDEFVFGDGADFGGTLDGGAGADRIDYSAYTSPVSVDLATGAATGTAGTAGIDAITGGAGSDTLRGPAVDATWTISGPNAGVVNGIAFSGIENLQGAADNEDTFIFTPGGGVSGQVHGGPGGFDSLRISGGSYATVGFTITGAQSGTVDLDGSVIAYDGLEPVDLDADAEDAIFNLTAGADVVVLEDDTDAGDDESRLAVTFGESPIFVNPTATLTINALGGADSITINALDSSFNADVTINAGGDGDTIRINAKTGDGTYTLSGGPGDDTYQFDDNWGANVVVVEAAGEGTDTLDFGPYSDLAPRDAITLIPGPGGSLTVAAEVSDGSSISLSATSADNFESLINANLDLSGMVDAPADELIAGLNGLVTFLKNLAAVGNFAQALPLLGGSADVAVAKIVGFAEALDELRLEVQRFFDAVPSVTTDDLIGYLNLLFTGAGRDLASLGAAILSPKSVNDTLVESGDTYAFNLSLDGGGATPISVTGVDTVADLVAALNAALVSNAATNGVVAAVERGGRIAFQVLGTEVNTFAVTALGGAAQSKLGFPVSPVSLTNVQEILRGLDPLTVKLNSGITLGVEFASGTPELRFNVDWRGSRDTKFFYNLGTEAQGLGLAFDLDAQLTALAELVLDFQLGVKLDPGDSTFFIDVDELRAGVEITSTAVSNAGLNIGFLDVQANGSVTLDAGVVAALGDTEGITL